MVIMLMVCCESFIEMIVISLFIIITKLGAVMTCVICLNFLLWTNNIMKLFMLFGKLQMGFQDVVLCCVAALLS